MECSRSGICMSLFYLQRGAWKPHPPPLPIRLALLLPGSSGRLTCADMALPLRPSLPDKCCIWSDISELLRMTGALGTGAKGSAASPVNSSEYMESLMSHVKACIPKEINSHYMTMCVSSISNQATITEPSLLPTLAGFSSFCKYHQAAYTGQSSHTGR